jgi:hypothetical protein
MQAIKEELRAEEKFFENTIRAERFIKQYQKPLIAGISIVVLGLVGLVAYTMYQENRTQNANVALNVLLSNPSDTTALTQLESNNKALFDLYTFSKAIQSGDAKALETLQKSPSPEIADLAKYESAVVAKKVSALETYDKTQGALLGDMATLELAVEALKTGNAKEAHIQLGRIKEDSALYPFAQMFNHYGVK